MFEAACSGKTAVAQSVGDGKAAAAKMYSDFKSTVSGSNSTHKPASGAAASVVGEVAAD